MHPALTVFVCSTYSDLTVERDAVLRAIERVRLQHESMELFGARSNRPLETCLAEVRRSNILVVIVGHRYGSTAPGSDMSFPHIEYEEGYGLSKPCLIYFRDENIPILPKFVERDPFKFRRLEEWKATLRDRHTVATFQSENDLAVLVATDLGRTLANLEDAKRLVRKEGAALPPSLLGSFQSVLDEALARGVSEDDVLAAFRRAVGELIGRDPHRALVHLSYSDDDAMVASKTAAELQSAGFDVSDDRAALKRPASEMFGNVDAVVFFISRSSVQSQMLQDAWNVAVLRRVSGNAGALFLPVIIESAEMPPLFRDTTFLDLRHTPTSIAAQRIVSTLREQLGYSRSLS